MFIYFWEQVWGNEDLRANFITEEVARCYWGQWNYQHRGTAYPKPHMEKGVDYVEY